MQKFERGEVADTVGHFQFNIFKGMSFAFSRDNLLVSGMKVDGKNEWDRINRFACDVYRFRNSGTSECLTACVGLHKSFNSAETILHIVKGEVYPDASFADY